MAKNNVTDFHLIPLSPSEIVAYKDWVEGDRVSDGSTFMFVVAREGDLVTCEVIKSHDRLTYTCDELYDAGFRLDPQVFDSEK